MVDAWPGCGTEDDAETLEYCKERGSSAQVVRAAGVRRLDPSECKHVLKLGKKYEGDARDGGVAFPFDGTGSGLVRLLADDADPRFRCPFGAKLGFYRPEVFPKSASSTTWAQVNDDASVLIYVTEGPTRALAGISHGLPTIAINGVSGWSRNRKPIPDFKTVAWKGREGVLVFDSDVLVKHEVQRALRDLAGVLVGLGAVVLVKELPDDPDGAKQGMDDFIARHGAKRFASLPNASIGDERFSGWGTDPATAELNERHAFVMIDGKAAIITESVDEDYPTTKKISLSRASDIELQYSNQLVMRSGKQVSKYHVWMRDPDRRNATRLWFRPGRPWGIDDGAGPERGEFNIYQGWPFEPHAPDSKHSWRRLQDHVLGVLANGNLDHAKYILDWTAWGVQNPDRLPEVALVFIGGEGTGKGIFCSSVMRLYGRHGMQLTDSDQLVGKHNDHLKDNLLTFADEAFFAGDKRGANKLKAQITEKRVLIEPKYVNAFSLPNYKKVMMASNEGWAINADIDAWRFAVFEVSDAHRDDAAYFDQIGDELESGGFEAMLYDLQRRDISNFRPQPAPPTAALLSQKENSFSATHEWYFGCLRDGRLSQSDESWEGRIFRYDVQERVKELTAGHYGLRNLATKIGMELKRVCPHLTVEQTTKVGKFTQGSQQRAYNFGPLDKCRKAFARAMRMEGFEWDSPAPESSAPPANRSKKISGKQLRKAKQLFGSDETGQPRARKQPMHAKQQPKTFLRNEKLK